jgi:PHD/YefM family antitoxin component YafN of YafNO toxin-antitoxin module
MRKESSRNLSYWVNQASYGRECVLLISRGRVRAVIIGVEAFETLLGAQSTATNQRMPVAQLRREFRQTLAEAGYQTKADLVALVQEVKRELVEEASASRAEPTT